jgi:hypothetical protein
MFIPGIEEIDELTKDKIDIIFDRKIYHYVIENIFKKSMSPEYDEYLWNKTSEFLKGKSFDILSEEERNIYALERAKTHSKNYPETRIENESIMINILDLLTSKGIKPILVVFPTTIYYYSQFNGNIKSRFYSIVSKLRKKYKFEVIDMFQSEEFDLQDFLDWDHLNKKGAEKMTKALDKMLNNII